VNTLCCRYFTLRSMASGAAFHRAYRRATQQSFLEVHEHAFEYFQGVFRTLRYDNLRAAVKKILRGYQREETARFVRVPLALALQSEFCSAYPVHQKGQASYATSLRTCVASFG
jgi:transposase